ncbi:MAG: D-alanyl-D-alanine carboxypeptidase/D-alanyl-D-alanine-endopeptidase, partial [Flavobacteriaceae bacterium]|nr:D-alanyl-D-alanine carboxypeptidase/D-alanyl-D-alanine-endopeptidase [Flavobacteriaceae bacterium]
LKRNPEQQKFVYISPYTNEMAYTEEFKGTLLYTKLPPVAFYLGNQLRANFIKRGVTVEGKVIDQSVSHENDERKKIMTYHSPTLEEIVYFINQTSNNAMSEALLKITGFYKKGDFSLETGRTTVNKHLAKKAFDFQGFNFVDGSGLSRSHTVTPLAQVKLLSSLMRENYFDAYFKSLPIAGQTGTLKSSFQKSSSYGNIFAKTGTLNRVKTLAGYAKTNSGKLLVFSLLINNYRGSVAQVKQKMEYLLETIMDL